MGSDSEEDRKERDEFAERLRKRDESHKRNVASRSGINFRTRKLVKLCVPCCICSINFCFRFVDKNAYEEAAKRLKLDNDKDRDSLMSRLRIESRRKYVKKRKDDKVTELEQDLADDEYLFDEDE